MNERINALAEQAGIAMFGDAVYMYNRNDTLDVSVMEKFAKLIVLECTDRIYNAMKNTDHSDLVYNAMLTAIVADIQERFGIHESKSERFGRAMESIFKNGADLSGKETP